MLSVEHKILMDLVTHHDHIIFTADRRRSLFLLLSTHVPPDCVWRAEYQFYMILFYFCSKSSKFIWYFPSSFSSSDIHNSSAVCDHFTERIVNRLLDDNCISRPCERLYCHRERKYHARRFHQPSLLHMPAMLLLHPCRNCLKAFFLYLTVSKNSCVPRFSIACVISGATLKSISATQSGSIFRIFRVSLRNHISDNLYFFDLLQY